jgi:hypothetical protein
MLSVLLVVVLLAAPLSSGVVVQPSNIETLSSSDVYLTIHNQTQRYLINVTASLPPQLVPVGATSNGRWNHIVTTGKNSYEVQWLGALASGGTAILGVAVSPTGGPRVLNLTIQESYDDGTRSNSTQQINLVCPCLLGIDVRYLAYGAIALVLLLPAFELVLYRASVLKRQSSQMTEKAVP